MRVGIMIRDTEYRDALVQKLSSYDNDVFVNIITDNIKDASGSVILTDVSPAELENKVLAALRPRTLFIVSSHSDKRDDCSCIFKFCSIHEMISELSLLYNRWRGIGPGIDHSSRLICICSESDSYSSALCRSLAGQILYRAGGSTLLLPMSYINDYGIDDMLPGNSLSRLLYSIRSGRDQGLEGVTYSDSYGLSSLLLSKGRNPVAYLDEEELRMLIAGLSGKYDTIIADSASCFREENIAVMKTSEKIVLFERGRRKTGIEEMLGDEALTKLIRVKLTGGTEDVLAMDECLRQIFGKGINESDKSSDSKEIRK